ncbi:MAG TPA: DUF3592 domain-containing protein [Burkholderiales bacterium]|jgi:hypothetical protein|nr:DUF3592 domain-containing protein [Burkholderiales bacterium]
MDQLITSEFSKSTNRRIGKFFLFLAGVSLGLTVWAFTVDRKFIDSAIAVRGVVIAVEKSDTLPTIRFTTLYAEQITFRPKSRNLLEQFSVGETVEVFYLKTAPNEAKLNMASHLWSGTEISGVFFVILGILGVRTVRGSMTWGPLKQTRITVGGG